ncbi:MAG TPA: aminoacylase [Bacteroidales bacterium]|nr:aminoacylase [Bacteroidales bacterium]
MKSNLISVITLILSLLFSSCSNKSTYDILIKGGTIIDGSGSEEFISDIGIKDGKIIDIGRLRNARSVQTIEARGLIVSPGFIDIHVHIEPIMEFPELESHLRQGVTTVLGGPDGSAPWPFGKYLDSLESYFDLGINVAYLTGHNNIRRKVMGNSDRKPAEEELNLMKGMVEQSMREGAFGISTGLKYLPGAFSETSEIVELSKVAAGMGGFYTSHLREEGLGLIESVREAIIIARDADIPVVLTHHKVIGKPMWGKSTITTGLVDSARSRGLDIMMDQYPYSASCTGIGILFPSWAIEGNSDDFKRRLADPVIRDSILKGIEFNILNDRGGGDARRIQFGTVSWDTTLEGKTLYDYAIREGSKTDPLSCARLVLQIHLNGGASCIYHVMTDEDVERIMKHPFTMIASDGGERVPHPRSLGTYPRVLGQYVREKQILTLREAIRKMTSMPAKRMGLNDRGLIKEGYAADITIFDRDRIIDKSTYEQPRESPEGIEYVIVNGSISLVEGEPTQIGSGTVLRGPAFKH